MMRYIVNVSFVFILSSFLQLNFFVSLAKLGFINLTAALGDMENFCLMLTACDKFHDTKLFKAMKISGYKVIQGYPSNFFLFWTAFFH